MSTYDYFKELNHRLSDLPEQERQHILRIYEEMFQKAIERGIISDPNKNQTPILEDDAKSSNFR